MTRMQEPFQTMRWQSHLCFKHESCCITAHTGSDCLVLVWLRMHLHARILINADTCPSGYFSRSLQSAGCPTGEAAPLLEGDVRLIAIDMTGPATAECDAVHFGGVEVFTGGRWERICNGERISDGIEQHTIVAQVWRPHIWSSGRRT